MGTPYHDSPVYDIDAFDTGISDTSAIVKLQSIIDKIDTTGMTVEEGDLIGDATLTNGGVYGDLLRLMRLHINDAKDNNELTEENAGEVYAKMMETALGGSIDFLFRRLETKRVDKLASFDLIKSLYESNKIKLNTEQDQVLRKKSMFELDYLMPLEREQLIETIENLHIEHQGKSIANDTASFNLADILPKEADKLTKGNLLLDDEHLAKVRELDIRTFYRDNIEVEEHTKLVKGNTLLDDEHLAKVKELDIRNYYRDNIEVEEYSKLVKGNKLLDDEHLAKAKELDIRTFYRDNIEVEEHTKLIKGNTLLTDEHNLKVTELNTKEYYRSSMQPVEKSILDNSYTLGTIENGIKTYYRDSIQPEELVKLTSEVSNVDSDTALKAYDLNTTKPLESTLLDDKHCSNILEMNIRKYYATTIMPIEASIKENERDLGAVEILIRTYYKDHIQPLEMGIKEKELELEAKKIEIAEKDILLRGKEIELKQKELEVKTYELEHLLPVQVAHEQADTDRIIALKNKLVAELCIVSKDCDIKTYYNSNIQPWEARIAEAKAYTEEFAAGGDGSGDNFVYDNSMSKNKIDQMKKQTELYDRQKWSYDERKYQKLLDIQVNYSAMVFADADLPAPLTLSTDGEIEPIRTALINAGSNPDD